MKVSSDDPHAWGKRTGWPKGQYKCGLCGAMRVLRDDRVMYVVNGRRVRKQPVCTQPDTTCTYPTGCTRKRLPRLTMCRGHQPYPAR